MRVLREAMVLAVSCSLLVRRRFGLYTLFVKTRCLSRDFHAWPPAEELMNLQNIQSNWQNKSSDISLLDGVNTWLLVSGGKFFLQIFCF